MKIGALYVRVSTHNQDELSPDAQIRLGKEFAEKIISPSRKNTSLWKASPEEKQKSAMISSG